MNQPSQEPSHVDATAPAGRLAHARWPAWKIALAYATMFAVAIASIWTIDRHVMKVAADLAREEGLTPP